MEHMGIEPGRLQFSWVSSAESTKFVKVVTEVTQAIKALGPNKTLVKTMPKVAENVELHR
jgi:coenzyme F420-reducing hydrogenase delta subunit